MAFDKFIRPFIRGMAIMVKIPTQIPVSITLFLIISILEFKLFFIPQVAA
jgi:hypothetical protein